MKKKYIRPESRLYAINLSENIASSETTGGDSVGGGSLVNGNMVIKFSSSADGCRNYYTGTTMAPVTVTGTFNDYYNELNGYVMEQQNYFLYFNCLKLM